MNTELNEFMKKEGLTDKKFGEMIGKSRIQVYRYRNGEQIPDKETVIKIHEISNGQVPPGSFYGLSA